MTDNAAVSAPLTMPIPAPMSEAAAIVTDNLRDFIERAAGDATASI